ncbi:MAG TPA: uracil-DNA glycosylase family protein [Stellaceae bacterium]|jgi:uracil-DNA glycosylase|nr:uracil-DNA glycosylase family protein [Stellaceae bacterium]
MTESLEEAQAAARACTLCADILPLGPRPIVRGRVDARLMIISQAPGTRVHETGLSFNDRSGDRLRDWMGIDRATFYDESRVAILGMGLCYPGVDAKGGDKPPVPACAPLWHPRLLPLFANVELTLLIGSYALRRYLGPPPSPGGMTQVVAGWRDHLPRSFPLPHPSWRNTAWLKRHPWFETEALPALRARIAALLDCSTHTER